MNKVKLLDLVKSENIVIPTYLLKLRNKFNLTLDEFFVLNYLIQKNFKIYDATIISDDLGIDINLAMGYISKLQEKDLIEVDIIDNEGIMEEVLSLEPFYDKLNIFLINQFVEKEEKDITIYSRIEKLFKRSLNNTEIDIIRNWEDNDIPLNIIEESIKIAETNNIYKINYIDKIVMDKLKEENLEKTMELFNEGPEWYEE